MNKEFPDHWVLIRGLTRGAFHWMGFEKTFKDFFNLRCVDVPDLPGNGILSHELSSTHLDEAVEQLRRKIEISDRQMGLLSISMGGMIATRWAEMYPQEISHIVLMNSSFGTLNPFYQRLMPNNYFSIAKNFLNYDAEKLETFVLSATSNSPTIWKSKLASVVEFQKKNPTTLRNFVRQLRLSMRADGTAAPPSKNLILGSVQDRLVNVNCSKKIAAEWNCKSAYHPTAGHDLSLDDPQWILDSIQKNFRY